jgi:hypothetical protein
MIEQLQCFNAAWVASFDSEKAFIEAMREECYAHIFPGKGRSEKLREVYRAIKGEHKPENPTDSFSGV